jgi:hypothetical protein
VSRFLRAALAAALLTISPAAHAEPIEQTVEEHSNDRGEIDRRDHAFVHRSSGYVFPLSLDGIPARKTYTYRPGDASIYYTHLGGGNGDPWLSLYVYPATRALALESRDVEQALRERMPGREIQPAGIPPAPPAVTEGWFEARVDGTPVLTGFRLAQVGDWFIKVRLTVPRATGESSLEKAWRALAAIPWSLPAGAPVANTTVIGR